MCLRGMHIAYVATTLLAALANGYAAYMNLVGAESVRVVADQVQVPQKWMVPFGTLLASGALGLVAGLAMPALGAAAATGLVAYFVCALAAHVRAHDSNVGGAVTFLLLAVATLVTGIGYHYHW
jgi:DoxX-like family